MAGRVALRPILAVAFIAGRRPSLLRRWYLAGDLTSACDVGTRAVLVDVTEAVELSDARQRRKRLPGAPGSP